MKIKYWIYKGKEVVRSGEVEVEVIQGKIVRMKKQIKVEEGERWMIAWPQELLDRLIT